MILAVLVPVILVGVSLAAKLARAALHRRDAERRFGERTAYKQQREAERLQKANVAVEQVVGHYFPFAAPEFGARRVKEESGRDRLHRVLANTPGISLGTASVGFPAVLPLVERRKHLIGIGKSGYGKTSIALRLIKDDLLQGRGVCILTSEAELCRDWLLPSVPTQRARDVVYFRPADRDCTVSWNPMVVEPGDDRALAAGELFSILKRSIGERSIGARADAILSSSLAALVGRPGATLWSVARLLEDEAFRTSVIADLDDPYLSAFWTGTFPEYPDSAVLPVVHRLTQFLRLPTLRAALCHPASSFSLRESLANDRIVLFDVSGLDPDATMLVGQMLLSKFQIELMRRERVPEQERRPFHVYVDEFHVFATTAEGTWRELLARGRRYGLGLHLFTQHPNQLPRSLQHEIFGNVSSVIALNLSGTDAATIRRELLVPCPDGSLRPIVAENLVSLPVGEGFARLAGGACSLRVKFAQPLEKPDRELGVRIPVMVNTHSGHRER